MDKKDNPCGLDGFAFLEFSGPEKKSFQHLFSQLGFDLIAQHNDQDVTLYQQGDIQFIVNNVNPSQAAEHAKQHGPGACAMGFKVKNAETAYQYTLSKGAQPFVEKGPLQHHLPAIQAIGGSVIYFVDETHSPFKGHWQHHSAKRTPSVGLNTIDHLTHNVQRGHMDQWAQFYEQLFNFREIRYFNIEGKMTGLISRAMASPCDKIKIPLNESKDDKSQIEEFLHEFKGEGIQHVALSTADIYHTVKALRQTGVNFLEVPDTYYEMIDERIAWHQEPVSRLQEEKILIDGEKDKNKGLLLQIFTENLFGPVFFEFIQRKGNQGFGEGNFQALFEAIERDQIRRGTLKE